MISASDAVEKATYGLLTGSIGQPTPIEGAQVFQHVPENTSPPVIIIGDIEEEPLAAKDDEDCRVSLSIVTVTEAEERKPVLLLQEQIKDRLRAARVDVEGWKLAFAFESSTATLTPDGAGYVGDSRFEILALRA